MPSTIPSTYRSREFRRSGAEIGYVFLSVHGRQQRSSSACFDARLSIFYLALWNSEAPWNGRAPPKFCFSIGFFLRGYGNCSRSDWSALRSRPSYWPVATSRRRDCPVLQCKGGRRDCNIRSTEPERRLSLPSQRQPLDEPPPPAAVAELLALAVKSNNLHSGGLASTGDVLLARSCVINYGTTRKRMFRNNDGCPRSIGREGWNRSRFLPAVFNFSWANWGGMPVLCGR